MPHTPGPWLYTPVDFDSCTMAIVDEDGASIFDMTVTENTTGHNALFNNAGLVSAAPTMLQALQSVLFTLEQEGDASVIAPAYKGHLAAEIRAAIRAATGEV